MKKNLFFMAIALLGLSSCFSMIGRITDPRSLTGFYQLENNTPYDIHYYESDTYRVNVVGLAADVPNIRTVLNGGLLSISTVSGYKFKGKPYIEVYCPKNQFQNYVGKGSGDFYAKEGVHQQNANYTISGTGDIRINGMNAGNLNMQSTGGGNIRVNNAQVNGQNTIQQGGSGNIRFNGQTQQTQINNNGTGNTKGKVVTNQFEGRTTNTGNINMRGQATTVTTEQKGKGEVEFKRSSSNSSNSSKSQTSNQNQNQSQTKTQPQTQTKTNTNTQPAQQQGTTRSSSSSSKTTGKRGGR